MTVPCNRKDGPRRIQGINFLLFVQLLLVILAQNLVIIAGQSVAAVDKEKASIDDQLDLHSMSNEELEEICTSRGFELFKELEEDTGNTYVFTHEDYVEAARQCLAVEQEMGEILAEHPELLDELKDEVDSMNKEKERLEQELADVAEKRAELEKDRADDKDSPPKAFFPHNDGAVEKETEKEVPSTKREQKKGEPEAHVEPEKRPRGKAENATAADEPAAQEDGAGSKIDDKTHTDLSEDLEEKPFLEEFTEEVMKPLVRAKELLTKGADKIPEPVRRYTKIFLLTIICEAKKAGLKVVELLDRYVIRTLLEKIKERRVGGDDTDEKVGNREKSADGELTNNM